MRYSIAFILLSVSLASATSGTISGTVVNDRGAAVPHLVLNYEPLDVSSKGGIPQTETDENGHFSFRVTVLRRQDGTIDGGKWAIYPHRDFGGDSTGYYPPNHRFYGTEHSNWQEVHVTPEAPDAVVEIKLAPAAGAIVGRVTDAVTGAPIKPYATVTVAWASDPSTFMAVNSELAGEMDPTTGKWRYNVEIKGKFRILVPAGTEVTLKAAALAKGYKPYEHPGVITVSSGRDKTIDIQLQTEN